MGLEFSAGEVFEMACQLERNGGRFYRKAAEATGDDSAKQVLLDLAEMEDDHLTTFTTMMGELLDQERTEPVFDPHDEAVRYLRAFADARVFDAKADPSGRLTGKESLGDILQTAIGLEKDSIAFYAGMQAMVPERLGKDKIDRIIREEIGHVVTLTEKLPPL